ncbi:MAG TPA: alpha/beta fold hydrolase, partial [Burkholderiaceae bacterium]|nr:alpha/beta fold hydrolase [Burkholderiaceae bacterium]
VVVLLVSGSGPTDRDGNSALLPGRSDSLKLLAQALADAGMATLRYDKRGVGASKAALAGGQAGARFETYVADAVAWLQQLKRDARFDSVVVLGHSEGALIGMLAAQQGAADAYVSLAGSGYPAAVLLRRQLQGKLSGELAQHSERILRSLEGGQTADDVPPALRVMYDPSLQPYLIGWFAHDPAAEFSALKMPALVVQGSTDLQVPIADANALHAANPASQLLIVTGMNHVLKDVPADRERQRASYVDPSQPLSPTLVPAIAAFVNGALKH